MNSQSPKILYLSADPNRTNVSLIDEEARAIRRQLRSGSNQLHFGFESREAVRLDDILESISEVRPTVVHFSGHGAAPTQRQRFDRAPSTEGIQIIEDPDGKRFLNCEDLRSIFENFASNVKLVILNVCYSEMQAKAISTIIDFTIGIRREIDSKSAIIFSSQLYSSLSHGRSLNAAFQQTIARMKMERALNNGEPRLITNNNADPEDFILSNYLRADEIQAAELEQAKRDYELGVLYFYKGFYTEAARLLISSTRRNPQNPEARYYLVLANLPGKRPRLFKESTVQKMENQLNLATLESSDSRFLILLAIIKYDYYIMNGLQESAPTVSQILSGRPKISRSAAAEIINTVSAPGNKVWEWLRSL